jgi:hypothetical protein
MKTVPLFLLVDKLLGLVQAATCNFSKEFCGNPGNVATNRKEGGKFKRE